VKELLISAEKTREHPSDSTTAIRVETKTLLEYNCAVINPDDRVEENNPSGQAATRNESNLQDQKENWKI
jgi:hypothetical protein